jgi:hypothetical protein
VNADNPFVKIWADSDKELTSLRKNLAGLSPGLKNTAAQVQQTLTDRNLFNARVTSALDASNLRQQAKEFRSGTRGESDNDFEKRINDGLQRAGFNPNDFNGFSTAQRANFLAQRQSVDFAAAASAGSFNGVSLDTLTRGALANSRQKASSEESIQERLDRQLKAAESITPQDKLQRADADSRILALTASIDPSSLRQDTRNKVADVLERRATETERREIEALREQQTQSKLLEQINAGINNLRGVAQKGGSAGVELIVKDETENGIRTVKQERPTQEKVQDLYGGFSTVQYGGGLTNR